MLTVEGRIKVKTSGDVILRVEADSIYEVRRYFGLVHQVAVTMTDAEVGLQEVVLDDNIWKGDLVIDNEALTRRGYGVEAKKSLVEALVQLADRV